MLSFFRNFFKSKLGVGITMGFLVLIALAFASADITGGGNFGGVAGGDRAATVGKTRIDTGALAQTATNALENLKQEDPRLSMKAFLARGGLNDVMEQMIDRTALVEFARQHGIIASTRLVDGQIAGIPAFKGIDGKFSEDVFRQALAQQGVSEKLFRDDLTQGLIARQLLVPAAFGAVMPPVAARRYAELLGEKRVGAIALVPSAAFAPKAPPSDAELSAYYQRARDNYIRPERRVIRFATFDDSAIKALPEPTEAQIAARYEANKAKYAASETRKLTQLIVPTQAAAQAILAELAKGGSFDSVARGKGLAPASIDPVDKAALAGQSSQAIADAVFAASEGAIAAPARSGLGWHVIRVNGIAKTPARSLDQVRGELVSALKVDQRRAAINDLSSQIEEQFDQGTNLTDKAKELGVTIQSTPVLTADGRPYDNPGAAVNPIVTKIASAAFAMEGEGKPQLAEIEPGKLFVIFDATNIQPSAPAPLAEIRDEVRAAWMLEKGMADAKKTAEAILASARQSGNLAGAVSASGKALPPVNQVSIGRQQLAQMRGQVPSPLALMFSMAQGTVKLLPGNGNQGWFVVSLKQIEPGKIASDSPVIPQVQRELGQVAGREYADALRRAIRAEVGVKRNETAIEAVKTQLGGGGN